MICSYLRVEWIQLRLIKQQFEKKENTDLVDSTLLNSNHIDPDSLFQILT